MIEGEQTVKCEDCQEELGTGIESYQHLGPGLHKIIWKKEEPKQA